MKKLLFALLLTLGAIGAEAQVRFETSSTDSVRQLAEKAKKLVFIDLYATWCGPCRMMEQEVFSRKDVGEFMAQRFICAKYDTDKSIGRELMSKYGRGAVPTYLIFNTAGDLLARIEGASPPREFMHDIDRVVKREAAKNAEQK